MNANLVHRNAIINCTDFSSFVAFFFSAFLEFPFSSCYCSSSCPAAQQKMFTTIVLVLVLVLLPVLVLVLILVLVLALLVLLLVVLVVLVFVVVVVVLLLYIIILR